MFVKKNFLILLCFSISNIICITPFEKSIINQAIINSNYNSFIEIYKNEELTSDYVSELKNLAEKILKDKIIAFKEKKYSMADKMIMSLGFAVTTYFSYLFCKSYTDSLGMTYLACRTCNTNNRIDNFPAIRKYIERLEDIRDKRNFLSIIAGLLIFYQGYKQSSKAAELKNSAAIKQLLEENLK